MAVCYLTGPGGERLDIKPNEPLMLGRGVCGIQDKRLSRQQIQLQFRGSDIECTTLGVNPSIIVKANSGMTVALRKGESCFLVDGDTITLLPTSDHTFKVVLLQQKAPSSPMLEPAEGATKRRLLRMSDEEDDASADSHAHAGKKARQEQPPPSSSSSKARPPCRYGAGCYRKNADHKREFSHPGDDDWGQTSSQTTAQHSSISPPSSPVSASSSHQSKPLPSSSSSSAQSTSAAPKPQLPVRVISSDTHMHDVPTGSPPTKVAAPRLLLIADTDNPDDDPTLKKFKTLDEARKTVQQQAQKQAEKAPPPPPKKPAGGYEFPAEKAAELVVNIVKEFLKKNAKMSRLQLVLVEPDEQVLAAFKKHAASLEDKRFIVRGGDISTLASKENLPCRYIAMQTTWRFKTIAHPGSKAIAEAASSVLEDGKKRYEIAKVTKAYPVAVARNSTLHKREGVDYVLCVPAPVCVKGKPDSVDEEIGADMLKKAYTDLFEKFLELTR